MQTEAANLSLPRCAQRWLPFGPYYAMFPIAFALQIVDRYTDPGDAILDPFAGRGTSVAAAAVLGRYGFGVEINPVGWLYATTKLAPADASQVLARLAELAQKAEEFAHEAEELPEFYHWCFSQRVRRFLLAARNTLRWRDDAVDRTLMAFILLYLHGKRGQALSNQMRQQKAMAPAYSVRWWKERGLHPPDLDPVAFLAARIHWRYAWGTIEAGWGRVELGDAREVLPAHRPPINGYKLLFTSPPYLNVTCYYYDNWLRYWLLGGPELPTKTVEVWTRESRHSNRSKYHALLRSVFESASELMSHDAVIYVRTDAREFTRRVTAEVLREVFPRKTLYERVVPFSKPTQTALFGHQTKSVGEVDIILV